MCFSTKAVWLNLQLLLFIFILLKRSYNGSPELSSFSFSFMLSPCLSYLNLPFSTMCYLPFLLPFSRCVHVPILIWILLAVSTNDMDGLLSRIVSTLRTDCNVVFASQSLHKRWNYFLLHVFHKILRKISVELSLPSRCSCLEMISHVRLLFVSHFPIFPIVQICT